MDFKAEDLINAIYGGKVTPEKLPADLYKDIANYLKGAINKGYSNAGGVGSSLGEVDALLIESLHQNIYMFSAAKTFHQVKEMSEALIVDGKVTSFTDFKRKADEIFVTYNKTWLRTEYDTAIGQAQNARKWAGFEKTKDLFPMLEYDAVMDANTSEICRPLNGIRLAIGDKFWDKHAPLNHFNCRCFLRQIDKYDSALPSTAAEVSKASEESLPLMEKMFKSNPGKTGEAFDKSHPYFQVPKKYANLAKKNFDLPIPKTEVIFPLSL